MAKDPAFLFYSNDFDAATKFFSHEQVGRYLRLLIAQHQHGHLSEKQMMHVCGTYDKEVFDKFKKDEAGLFFNERLEIESEKRKSYTESRRQSRLKSDEDNVKIYLIKDLDTSLIKIGSSVNPLRRFSEMCNQENPAITVGNRNYKLIWQSEILPRSEEKVLHEYFSAKRVNGEWFSLDTKDVNYIKTTYEKRTSDRTENENENENIIESDILNSAKKQKPFPDCLDDIKPEKPKQEPVTLENPFGKEFHQTHWQNWKIYRTQTLKKPVKPGSESAALKELWDDSGGDPVTAAKMIQKSIANGYQGLFPVNGKANGKPQTANQQIHDLANNGVFLKPPPDKFVEVIQADGQRFTGNLELDNGLIVFVKAGRNRVTIDPQNDFHASCTYKLAPGRTIQEVYEYLINEQMELV